MIEVASYPANLANWDDKRQPFYLELFGETSPLVDIDYAEVTGRYAVSPDDGTGTSSRSGEFSTPIYEYWWTIGHSGNPHDLGAFWRKLGNPAARVYLYFPTSADWRSRELAATVNYLQPVEARLSRWAKFTSAFKGVQPLIAGAGEIAKLAPLPAAGDLGAVLNAVGKLQLNNVPQTGQFAWSVGKVTFASKNGAMQGVMWTLPPAIFTQLGGRITGSLAVTFVPTHHQVRDPIAGKAGGTFETQAILAHAVVYGPNGEVWAPSSSRRFVRLTIEPQPLIRARSSPQVASNSAT